MKIKLDAWQEKVLKTDGNICLRSGRQVGKSTIISIKAAKYALQNKKKSVLVIAAVERQAYLLFEKILGYLADNYKKEIKGGKEKPTKHKITLTNGSTIMCYPTGLSGYGIRGFTVDLLIADEAAFIPEEVWTAVTPMLATTKGSLILLSTPHGKGGFYYRCFKDKSFTSFHRTSEECPRVDKEFLKKEKERMTKIQYAQEYLGEFVDDLRQFFSDELISKSISLLPIPERSIGEFYLGVDFAGYGGDENAFVVVERYKSDKLEVIHIEKTSAETIKNNITGDTIDRILILDKRYKFKKIFIDDGGLGSPILDFLLQKEQVRRKVVALNNAKKSIEWKSEGKERGRHILKEDLYGNLLRMMEQGKIRIINDDDLRLSLKSVQYEYTENKRLRIFGKYTHLTEALVRAAWGVKNKSLNIWVY